VRRRSLSTAFVLALCAVVAVFAFVWYEMHANRARPQRDMTVIVPRGDTLHEIAAQLAEQGVIDNTLTFRMLAKLQHADEDVRAGEYRFEAHMTQQEVLRALVTGGAQVATWVTIPEGFTAAQIAQRLHDSGAASLSDLQNTFRSETLDVDGTRTKSLEGFLFPSTYLVPLGSSAAAIAAIMTAEFFKQLPPGAARRAKALHVTVPQAVTVASLVEREAKSEADRPKIAAVIYNRLRLGMPLQVDATIEYVLARHKPALSFADLRIESPYNTYLHAGLPPTPIANPGSASLRAALTPAHGDDLYYVYCGHGAHAFATTLAQHQANVARCLP
jgi:UPF0755 protein